MSYVNTRGENSFVINDFPRHKFVCEHCRADSSSTSRLATFCQKLECQKIRNERNAAKERLRKRR